MLAFVESLQDKDKGNVKVASVKQKHSDCAKAESSDSGSSSLSDVNPSVFCGNNVRELVKLLKSATEPLHQLIAEAEDELATESQAVDSSSFMQKHEKLVSNLKTQYSESVRALLAVKRTKLQSEVKNCTADDASLPIVSVERLGDSVADTKSKSSPAVNSTNNSSRASRADIEAQRDLHKQMLSSQDGSSDSDSSGSESSTSSEDAEASSDENSDDDDEYDPKKEIQQVKLERGRERQTNRKKLKIRAGKCHQLMYLLY